MFFLKNSPGASAAAVELLRPGCGKRAEGKAWTVDWAMVAIRGAPLGMNSLAAGLGACWHKKKHVRVTGNLPLMLEAIKMKMDVKV